MRRTTHDTHDTDSTDSTSTGAAPAASAATPAGARRSMGHLLLTAVGIALLAAAPACAAAPPPAPAPVTAQRVPVVSCRHGHPREAPSTSHCRLRTVVLDVPIR